MDYVGNERELAELVLNKNTPTDPEFRRATLAVGLLLVDAINALNTNLFAIERSTDEVATALRETQ